MSDQAHPVERILGTGLRRLLMWAVPLVSAGLVFRAPMANVGLFEYTIAHLAILQIATFAFVIEMSALTDRPWFRRLRRPWLASVASLVAGVVGSRHC